MWMGAEDLGISIDFVRGAEEEEEVEEVVMVDLVVVIVVVESGVVE